MFVVSLISNGQLKKTSIQRNANAAVDLAHDWYDLFWKDCPDGYIVIDQQEKGELANIRFAEIRFDQSPDEMRLYLVNQSKKPVFTSKFQTVTKQFLVVFLEFALVRLTDYLRDRSRNNGKGGSDE